MTLGVGSDANPRDGDRVTFTVEVADGRVRIVGTELNACGAAKRAAEEIRRRVGGEIADEIARIQVREIIDTLRLDADGERCALTALSALQAAIVDARVKQLA